MPLRRPRGCRSRPESEPQRAFACKPTLQDAPSKALRSRPLTCFLRNETNRDVDTDRPPPSFIPVVSKLAQRRGLAMFALASLSALAYFAIPVASGLFLGTLVAFSLLRTHDRLSQRLGHPGLAALIIAVGSGLAIVGTIVSLAYFLIARGIQ